MRTSLSIIALAVGSFAALPVFAAPIDPIELGFTGVASVGATTIDFGASPTAGPFVAEPNYGTFSVTTPVLGVFASAGISNGDTGFIESLSMGAPNDGTFTQPFIKFNNAGTGVTLDLSKVDAGSTIGPFNLADTPAGATASFSVAGTIMGGTAPASGLPFQGVFSATFSGITVTQLEAEAAAGMAINTPFSATISTVSVIPEPASLALLGLGLLGLGVFTRKKIRG